MKAGYVTAARLRELEDALGPRDLDVLHRVASLRFVSGDQLTRLCFAGDDQTANARAARRSLLRLTRLGVLARLPRPVGGVRAGSAGFVYRLDVAGQRLSMDRGWQPKRRTRRSHTPGSLFVRHALAVAELHVLLVEADRSGRVELLELSAEPSCWRSYAGLGSQRLMLKPDSYVRLGLGPYEDSYFVEVDRGTEGSRALSGQLDRYLAYHANGGEQADRGVFPKVLWLTPDTNRRRVIEACIGRLAVERRGLFEAIEFAQTVDHLADPRNPPTSVP